MMIFYFLASSPRISANNRSTITIRDNDSPFGIISFTSQSSEITTQESSGNVTLNLRRTGGVFSRVTVLVRSIGGGEPWQSEVLSALPSNSPIRSAISARSKAASALPPNRDYIQLNKQITFPVRFHVFSHAIYIKSNPRSCEPSSSESQMFWYISYFKTNFDQLNKKSVFCSTFHINLDVKIKETPMSHISFQFDKLILDLPQINFDFYSQLRHTFVYFHRYLIWAPYDDLGW